MRNLGPALALLAALTAITGAAYPLALAVVGHLVAPSKAHGSLVEVEGRVVGSRLIGQSFDAPGYFRGRPSATSGVPYDASSSAGSNRVAGNPAQDAAVAQRAAALGTGAPADLLTASGSGLDPHVSVDAALFQVPRVAAERGMSENVLREIVLRHVEGRTAGLLGERRVNVLELNLSLPHAP